MHVCVRTRAHVRLQVYLLAVHHHACTTAAAAAADGVGSMWVPLASPGHSPTRQRLMQGTAAPVQTHR